MQAFLCSTQQFSLFQEKSEFFIFFAEQKILCVLYISLVDSNKVKKLPHDVSLSLALVLEKQLHQTINSISMIKFNKEKIQCEKNP